LIARVDRLVGDAISRGQRWAAMNCDTISRELQALRDELAELRPASSFFGVGWLIQRGARPR
jgi:hypothetical protein